MTPHWPHGVALWMIGTFAVAVAVGTVVNWWRERPDKPDVIEHAAPPDPYRLPPRAGINAMFDPRPGRRT